jgi:hypothetical protein
MGDFLFRKIKPSFSGKIFSSGENLECFFKLGFYARNQFGRDLVPGAPTEKWLDLDQYKVV